MLQSIQKFENIDYAENSTKKKVSTLGLQDKSVSKHLQITFVGANGVYSPLFQITDFEDAENSLNQHIQKFYEEYENIYPPQEVIDVIKNAKEIQFEEDLKASEKLSEDNNYEIKKIKKYLEKDEKVLFVTRQDKEDKTLFTNNKNLIFATNKRILLVNNTKFRTKNLIKDLPYDSISSLTLLEDSLLSTIVFNGAGFAEVNTMSQASLQRAWGIEEESVLSSIPNNDAKEFAHILRTQIEKNGIKNFEFIHKIL